MVSTLLRRLAVLLALLAPAAAHAACSSLPFTLQGGTPAVASQVMANFNSVVACINSSIGAAIVAPATTTIGDAVGWGSTTGTQLTDLGSPPALIVASNTALRALTPGVTTVLIRNGYAAAGDAPPMTFVWAASCPGAFDNRAKYVNPNLGGLGCWSAAGQPELADPREWGAVGDGVTDDTLALQALINAANGGSVTINPAGLTYLLSSTLLATLTAPYAVLTINDNGTFKGAGLSFTMNTPSSVNSECYTGSFRIGAIDIVATTADAGTGLALTSTSSCAGAASAPLSTVAARIHGDYETTYWTTAFYTTNISDLNFTGDVHGRAVNVTPGPAGIGWRMTGNVTQHVAQINAIGAVFTGLATGIWVDNYVEGVTLDQVNITNMNGGCGVLIQDIGGIEFQILNSQIGLVQGAGHAPLCFFSAFTDAIIDGNTFINMQGNSDIWFATGNAFQTATVSNNVFYPFDVTAASALYLDQTSGNVLVSGNYFANVGHGVEVHSAAAGADLSSNDNRLEPGGQPALVINSGSSPNLKMPDTTDLRNFNAKCDGTTDDSTALTAANSVTGINRIGFYATCRLSNNVTLTRPIYLSPVGAASVDTGKTLTLAGIAADTNTPFPGLGTIAGYLYYFPGIKITPTGLQPMCINPNTEQVYVGTGSAC